MPALVSPSLAAAQSSSVTTRIAWPNGAPVVRGLLARRPRAGDNTSRLRAFGFNRAPATPWLGARCSCGLGKSLKLGPNGPEPAFVQAKQEPDSLRVIRKRIQQLTRWSGRQDLNLRPPGPEPRNRPVQRLRTITTPAQPLGTSAAAQSNHHNDPARFAEILLPICYRQSHPRCTSWPAGSSAC